MRSQHKSNNKKKIGKEKNLLVCEEIEMCKPKNIKEKNIDDLLFFQKGSLMLMNSIRFLFKELTLDGFLEVSLFLKMLSGYSWELFFQSKRGLGRFYDLLCLPSFSKELSFWFWAIMGVKPYQMVHVRLKKNLFFKCLHTVRI